VLGEYVLDRTTDVVGKLIDPGVPARIMASCSSSDIYRHSLERQNTRRYSTRAMTDRSIG
jgi:hypothetical protein